MTDDLGRVPDRRATGPIAADAAGLRRRSFLAAGAAAAVFAGSRSSPAQDRPPDPSGPTAMPDTVRIERLDGAILLIGIDLPDPQRRLDAATFIGLGRAYHLLDHDPALRVGILHAQGSDFATGLEPASWAPFLRAGRFDPGTRDFVNPVGTVPPRRDKPLVVAVQGRTQFAGHELFLAADVRVAASDAVFGQGEVTRGHFPAGGATVRFVREAGWGNAMRWMLTGEEWSADDAYRLGLVQEVTPPGQQLDRAIAVARGIAAAAPLGIRATLGSAHRALRDGEDAAFAALFAELGRLAQSDDHREYFRALQEQRAPAFRGR